MEDFFDLYNGDSAELLEQFPRCSVDLVVIGNYAYAFAA